MAWITTKNLARFASGFYEKAALMFAKITDIPESLPADGGDAATVNGHTVNANVPAGAKFTDTMYGTMRAATASAAGAAGLVPAPAAGKQNSVLRGDGTWIEITEATDTEIDAIITQTFK